jgi:hypothetical protein
LSSGQVGELAEKWGRWCIYRPCDPVWIGSLTSFSKQLPTSFNTQYSALSLTSVLKMGNNEVVYFVPLPGHYLCPNPTSFAHGTMHIYIFHNYVYGDLINILSSVKFWVVILGFVHRASVLLSRHSSTQATLPTIFTLVTFQVGSHVFILGQP